MKILLVEDDPLQAGSHRRKLQKFMASIGEAIDVDLAANGPAAVEMTKAQFEQDSPYVLILMDIGLPVFDGIEAARRITQDYPEARIVALSANYSAKVAACQDAGMCGGFVKPLNEERIQQLYSQYLQKSS